MNFRIGQGYDAHKLTAGNGFVLGGVKIKSDKTIIAHSDGDVLVHAIIDAILGAASLGDIGQLFPSNNQKYKDVSSLLLLKEVFDLLKTKGYLISNIDSTVIIESPKLSEYRMQMEQNIANVLELDKNQVSVKFTTTEGLGFEGVRKGVSAQAVCLVYI